MNSALNSALSHFNQQNGELIIGGRPVSSLANEFGTPLYIYDTAVIDWRHRTLRAALPGDLQIYYSVKANPNVKILKVMSKYYDGVDIASQGEMEKAIKAGISTDGMSFTGPGKSFEELSFAIKQNIGNISVESEREVQHIQAICRDLDMGIQVLVRVNPPYELSGSGMKMGGGAKKFGIDSEKAPELIDKIQSNDRIDFGGIHIFCGSQNLESLHLIEMLNKNIELAIEIVSSARVPLETFNMGGGFGIPYFSHDKDLDIKAVGNCLKDILMKFAGKLPDTKFQIELGRFLIGESGIYLSRILYRKVSRGKTFLITDGGMHHHLAASGNLGQSFIRRPMPITIANRLNAPLEKVDVTGPLCTPLDTFGAVEVPQADEGDLVVVFNSGAYGFSASPVGFLSHDPPREVVI